MVLSTLCCLRCGAGSPSLPQGEPECSVASFPRRQHPQSLPECVQRQGTHTHSHTHSLTHSHTHSLTPHSLTHSILTHSHTHTHTHSLTHTHTLCSLPALSCSAAQLTTFMVMYRTHCQRILDSVARANFSEVHCTPHSAFLFSSCLRNIDITIPPSPL